MGALAPAAPWIPEDDLLLKNAVEVPPLVLKKKIISHPLLLFSLATFRCPFEWLGLFTCSIAICQIFSSNTGGTM